MRVAMMTREYPPDVYGGAGVHVTELVAQLRRSAASVPANIAEGAKRLRKRDYARFLNISEASLAETSYLLILGRDLGYSKPEIIERILVECGEISRMLHALRTKVEHRGDP